MALIYSTMPPLGTSAPDFDLPDPEGNRYSLSHFQDKPVLVIVVMCNHCPYVLAVLERLIDLQNEFRDNGVQFVGINSNDTERYPDDSPENMKKLADEKKFSFPYLFDQTQETAKAFGAVCTPDIFVYGKERTLLYRGRVDDNWQEPDKITKTDLRDAIQLILQGKDVFEKQIPSMGCSIKWQPS